MDISKHLEEILTLQLSYSKYLLPEMSQRNDLINRRLPQRIRSNLSRRHCPIEQPYLRSKGRTGTGNNAQVPMVHISDRRMSSTPNEGWYVVYLFANDGSAVFASLNTRSTDRVDRPSGKFDIKPRPLSEMLRDRRWARGVLGPITAPGEQPLVSSIDLSATSPVACAYQETHVTGFRYARGSVPDDETLLAELKFLLGLLVALYGEIR